MPKREYHGPPIDATEQYLSEREKDGETVAGTTDDDLFQEETEWLPNGVDESDFSDKQKQALRAYLAHTDRETITTTELAHENDFSKETARRAIHKAFPDTRGLDDVPGSIQLAIKILAFEGEDKSQKELANEYPISSRGFGEANRVYGDLVAEAKPITEQELNEAIQKYERESKRGTASKRKDSDEKSGSLQKSGEEKEYPDDFSQIYQWFIETISEHPDRGKREIAALISEDQDFSPQNFYNVIRSHSDTILEQIKEKGTASSLEDLDDYLAGYIDEDAFEDDGESDDSDADESPTAIERRLRAVESKAETLRQDVDRLKNGDGTDMALADAIIETLSDEQLGEIVREAIVNE